MRKPAGSVRNRAPSSHDQRCRLAPGRRSNEEDGLDPGAVQRAHYPSATLVQDMRVDHRGRYVLVAEELLDRPDVVAPIAGDGWRTNGLGYGAWPAWLRPPAAQPAASHAGGLSRPHGAAAPPGNADPMAPISQPSHQRVDAGVGVLLALRVRCRIHHGGFQLRMAEVLLDHP